MSDITSSITTGVSNDLPKNTLPEQPDKHDWGTKTSARVLSDVEFSLLKNSKGLHIVGVTGFSGQWADSKLEGDAVLKSDSVAAAAALREKLVELKAEHGSALVISSGATNEGVPKIIYQLCEELRIKAMGVTSEKAFDYQLGTMEYLIVVGENWGDESPTFLNTSDEILMLGGGGQAKREAIAADQMGKRVTVFQGFKGSADQLNPEELPHAEFIARH